MASRRKWNPATGRYELQDGGSGVDFNNPFGLTPSTTAAPKPKAVKPNQGPVAPSTTTTIPKAPTTTAPTTTAPKATTTTMPAKPTTRQPSGATAGRSAGGFRKAEEASNAAYGQYVTEGQNWLDSLLNKGVTLDQLATLLGQGSGSGSSAASKAAATAAKGRAGYQGGMAAAQQQLTDATAAQQMYNQLAEKMYAQQTADIASRINPQIEAMKQYYAGQQTTAQGTIDTAAANALAGLVDPTAYQNLQAPALAAPTQSLGLGDYGATGTQAAGQAELDAQTAKFLADIQNRGYQQTQAANVDYNTAVKNAVTASKAGNTQALTNLIAGLQAQDMAGLRGAQTTATEQATGSRDAMLLEGIKALLAGQQAAGTTKANTLASYGAYAPKKKKPKK